MPGNHRFCVHETSAAGTGADDCYSWTVDLPSKCVLRTARARVFVFTAHDKVRLVIHYRMYRKAKVTVGYKLAGRKGRLNLGRAGAS